MEVRVVFSDSEFESVQKCASEEGEDVSAFIRGATLELVKDIEDIPAVEPASQSFLKNFGDQANGVVGWLRDNKDIISAGVDFIRGIAARRAKTPAAPLPPING